MRLFRISILVLFSLIMTCFGWERTYGGPGDQFVEDIAPTTDGCWVVVGTYLDEGDTHRVMLVKVDTLGEELFDLRLNYKSDGVRIYQPFPTRFIIWPPYFMVDNSGDIIWVSYIPFWDLYPLSDMGFVCRGRLSRSDDYWPYETHSKIGLGKANANGDVIHQNWNSWILEELTWGQGYAYVKELSDGSLIAIGAEYGGGDGVNPYMAKFTSTLVKEWQNFYYNELFGSYVTQSYEEDGYFIAGQSDSNFFIMKVDTAGDSIWARTYSHFTEGFMSGLVEVAGAAVIGGYYQSDTLTNVVTFLLKVDEVDGDTIWNRIISDPVYPTYSRALRVTNNDGFIMAGYKQLAGHKDVWIARFDSLGYTGIEENSPTAKPEALAISAYPNPFNSSITISLDFGSESAERLSTIEIFDLNGRRITVIPDTDRESSRAAEFLDSRFHGNDNIVEYIWFPDQSLGSGLYLIRIEQDGRTYSKQVVYVK